QALWDAIVVERNDRVFLGEPPQPPDIRLGTFSRCSELTHLGGDNAFGFDYQVFAANVEARLLSCPSAHRHRGHSMKERPLAAPGDAGAFQTPPGDVQINVRAVWTIESGIQVLQVFLGIR